MRTTRARQLTLAALVTGLLITALSAAHAVGTGTIEPPPKMAFVARADNPADALAVGPIAGRYGAPLYTTYPDVLDPQAEAGLQAYNPDLVIVAGGDVAIHPDTMQAIRDALPSAEVIRVFGAGRNETARKVSDLIDDYSPAFLPVDATAQDADLLDGLDSTAFARYTLPPGRTLTGLYYLEADGDGSGRHGSEISFPAPLAQDPDAWFVYPGDTATVACPGGYSAPSAAPGNLCVYVFDGAGYGFRDVSATPSGAFLWFEDEGTPGELRVKATWAVTAHTE